MSCLCLNLASDPKEWRKLNRPNRVCSFRGNVQLNCVWWCSSLPGAQVSQWTGSCSGWVNEVSPQEDVSFHLWLPTLSGQHMAVSLGCGCKTVYFTSHLIGQSTIILKIFCSKTSLEGKAARSVSGIWNIPITEPGESLPVNSMHSVWHK